MGSFILSTIVTILAFATALAAALPLELQAGNVDGQTTRSLADACTKAAINDCITATGLDGPLCFTRVCMRSLEGREQKAVRRWEDTCTEDALIQCSVAEWREPEICFQELCL